MESHGPVEKQGMGWLSAQCHLLQNQLAWAPGCAVFPCLWAVG